MAAYNDVRFGNILALCLDELRLVWNMFPIMRQALFAMAVYPIIYSFLVCLFLSTSLHAQYSFHSNDLPPVISLHNHAEIFDAGKQNMDLKNVIQSFGEDSFLPIEQENMSLGFTDHYFWIKTAINNLSGKTLKYYLETGRPITDRVDLYLIDEKGNIKVFKSGDTIPFESKSFPHRKSIFPLEFEPDAQYKIYIHFKSDGEVLNLPILLRTEGDMIQNAYFDQLIFGLFYGMLLLVFITYLFFFFAMKDKSFLFYCLYVASGAALQFSLDGYFHQYIAPNGGWIGRHAVILSAIFASYFFAWYTQVFLRVSTNIKGLDKFFIASKGILILLFLVIIAVPDVLPLMYPIANILGLFILLMVSSSVVILYIKKQTIDHFFSIGISILIISFIVFILNNLSILSNSFLSENSVKFGTGLEILFLSLSMGNRIRILKSEKEEMQALALKKSEEMNGLKSYFLSNMSHELRTPLNAIMGISYVMAKETDDPSTQHNSEIIRQASLGLLASINNILDFSKIEKNELRLEKIPFDLITFLEEIVGIHSNKAKDKNITFEYRGGEGIPAGLIGDPSRLGQILNNVLDNAIKFTTEGSVLFEFDTVVSENGDHVEVTMKITDTGIGIPKNKLEDIFESLTQSDISHKRKYGGFGLGLFIVKALVNLHNGKVEITSQPGVGTTCRIELTYEVQEQGKGAEVLSLKTNNFSQEKQILVVEDNKVNQLVMRAMLKKWPHTMSFFAKDGQEALEILKKQDIDIILMDLQMPVMDGYEATIAIREGKAGEKYTNIPIIAITADVMEGSKDRVFSVGMNDYLTKPVDAERVHKVVMSHFLVELEKQTHLKGE